MGEASPQAASSEFEEPIQTTDFSVEDSSTAMSGTVSPVPTLDDGNVVDEGIQQVSGFSTGTGSLETSPRRSKYATANSKQAEATKKPLSSWGRFWHRD